MHGIHTNNCPAYMHDMVLLASANQRRTGLRSADNTDYIIPRLRIKFGERCFAYAGPCVWNELPSDLRGIKCTQTFKCHFKTFLFLKSFS